MVGEDSAHTEERGVIHRFVSQGGERAVRMDELDTFAEEDVAEVWEEEEEVGKGIVGCDGEDREVVDLQAGDMADAHSTRVMMRDHDDLGETFHVIDYPGRLGS